MAALSCQSFKTSEKRDIKYIKRFIGHKIDENWEEMDVYCYDHKINDNRDLAYVFKLIWKNHKLTNMKPEEESNILILHYCRKGTFKPNEA